MRNLSALALLLAATFAAFPLRGAETPPFASFQGDYLEHGTVTISHSGDPTFSGTTKIRFQVASNGERARLKVNSTIKLADADRSFSGSFTFRHKHNADISNLAPGLDDGHPAEGAYAISPRRITAEFPFVIGTTTGKATLLIRLKKRAQRTQIIVVQTLSSSSLAHPITWTYKALSGS